MATSGISTAQISEWLRGCGADNVVMILDAYRSGGQKDGKGIGDQTREDCRQTGVISLFSCSPNQFSYELPKYKQGAFTKVLLEGLGTQGACATVARLDEEEAKKSRQYTQNSQVDSDSFKSETEIDYTKLQKFLNSKRWKDADQETLKIMLKIAKREDQGWLDADSLCDFSSKDLAIIDQLWVTASKGHFGFSVQKQIWEKLGSPMAFNSNWLKCLNCFGWKKSKKLLRYDDLKFSITHSPAGELPGMCNEYDFPGSFTSRGSNLLFGSYKGGSIELWCLFARDDLRSIPEIPGD